MKKKLYIGPATYEGETKDDIPHGYGYLMIKHEFDSYEGEFKKGLYHGHGIRIRPHGELYRGEFKNNKYNGIGELKNLLGNKGMYVTHYGEFKDNQRHGIGLQLNSNGSTLQGTWKSDEQHGDMIYTTSDGEVKKLVRKNDRLQSILSIHKVKEPYKNMDRLIPITDPEFQKLLDFVIKNN